MSKLLVKKRNWEFNQTKELLSIDSAVRIQTRKCIGDRLIVAAATREVKRREEVDIGTQCDTVFYINLVVVDRPARVTDIKSDTDQKLSASSGPSSGRPLPKLST